MLFLASEAWKTGKFEIPSTKSWILGHVWASIQLIEEILMFQLQESNILGVLDVRELL